MTVIVIRIYKTDDARPLADLFRRSVREIARKDYSADQLAAWAPDETDLARFHAMRSTKPTFVARSAGQLLASPIWSQTATSTCCSSIPISNAAA